MIKTREIVGTLPGYNKAEPKKSKSVWNTDFQSYNPPMSYKVLEQDKKGGACIVMIIAAIVGLIIAACLGVL